MKNVSIYEKEIKLSTTILFTLPTMVLMVFMSLYTVVDGIVVSNFVGSVGLSALNIVYPLINLTMAVSFMFATGSNAIIGRKLGEGKKKLAGSFMTLTVITAEAVMIVMIAAFMIFDEQLYRLMGADDILMPYCIDYGMIMIPGSLAATLQILFQNYLVTADKTKVSLMLTVIGGVMNIILDIVLVGVMEMGIIGAGIASVAGQAVAGIIPLFIFAKKDGIIHFEKPVWNTREMLFSMANGSSEMVTNIASAVTTTLFNLQMMAIVGEKGVAAISAILYLHFIFAAIFLGYTSGIGPVISYNYGAGNKANLHRLFMSSLKIIGVLSIIMFVMAEFFNEPLVLIFASNDLALKDLMTDGFRIIAVCYIFTGINIFASGYFTSLNNGKISAVISTLRTFIIEAGALILLPVALGLNGVWLALPIAETCAAIVSIGLLFKYRKKYGY